MKQLLFLIAIICALVTNAQNVGIGTATPTQKLDVNGNVNISGTIITNGTAGTNGQVLTSTGNGLAWSSVGNQMGYRKCKMFMTAGAGSFMVPTGVTEVMVEAWGAGSGGTFYCGGTSGGYARTIQTVASGATISFVVGAGSAGSGQSSPDAGSTTVTFPNGATLSAYGGGGIVPNGSVYITGIPKSGGGTVDNAYFLYGNIGQPLRIYHQITGTNEYETQVYGAGGSPVGMGNAIANYGTVIQRTNGVNAYSVEPSASKTPSAGAPCYVYNSQIQNGSDGMVIFWFN